MSMAKISLMGRVGSVKEKGEKINFSVAHNESKDKTTWYQCFLSKKQTEIFKDFISKGDLIYIEGKLTALDENGTNLVVFPNEIMPVLWKRQNLEFTANDIPF